MRGERRRYFRLAVSIAPGSLRRIDARGHVLGGLDAQIIEISGGGARLRVRDSHLLLGHRLALVFALADEPFALTGHIAWVDAETDDGTLIVGLGFDELDAQTRRRIVASMNEHRRQPQPQAQPAVARRLR